MLKLEKAKHQMQEGLQCRSLLHLPKMPLQMLHLSLPKKRFLLLVTSLPLNPNQQQLPNCWHYLLFESLFQFYILYDLYQYFALHSLSLSSYCLSSACRFNKWSLFFVWSILHKLEFCFLYELMIFMKLCPRVHVIDFVFCQKFIFYTFFTWGWTLSMLVPGGN